MRQEKFTVLCTTLAEKSSFNALKTALTARFQPFDQGELFRTQFRSTRKQDGERLLDFGMAARTLAYRAFPRMTIEQRDVLSRDQFIEALATTSSAFVFVWQSRLPWMTPSKPLLSSEQFKLQKPTAVQPLIATKTAEAETRQGHVVVPTSPVAAVHDAMARTMKEMVNVLRGMSSDGATRGGYRARARGSGRQRPIDCWHCGEVGHIQARFNSYLWKVKSLFQ